MDGLEESLREIRSMLKEFLKKKKKKNESDEEDGAQSSYRQSVRNNNHMTRGIKAELPIFDGDRVEEWVFKAREYFEWYAVPEDMRVRMISFHLTGPAYAWYRWGVNNNIRYTWDSFLEALLVRFGQNQFYDPKAALKELKQVNTVAEYQSQFEELTNQVTGLSEEWVISLFVGGLQDYLKCELLLAKPTSYVTAVSLAKLYEQKNNSPHPKFTSLPHPNSRHNSPNTNPPPTRNPNNTSQPQFVPVPLNSPNTNNKKNLNSTPPFKKLSAAEIKMKREKGLCYYCDEKWSPGHRCKTSCYLLIGDEEMQEILKEPEPAVIQITNEEQPVVVGPAQPEISFNAMVGQYQPTTFRLKGSYKGHEVMVLIDGGSSHNFVKANVAEKLDFPIQQTTPLQVLVGNGDVIGCKAVCENVPLVMQGYQFTISTFMLDLQGADIVLGVQWLMCLGYVTTHYGLLTMEFVVNNLPIKLQGNRLLQSEAISNKMLRRMVTSEVVTTMYHLKMVDEEKVSEATIPMEVQRVLEEHQEVFEEPTQLPPHRDVDHNINLIPGSQPVSIRPYKYPHFQKEEMERLVSEMLEAGIIQRSHVEIASQVHHE
ncbi:uncharacterized protein LOC107627725 [Arachis ipaensis]|uniref:uncharacterized protein LOC107627725 n=1 Tax=Arachis ipaensis TaxID=130454 RepID=UPI0007AF380A|nr:uncharacterized protein LOC107627725 [Arachis ipaensis]